jgi:hypothetical protein
MLSHDSDLMCIERRILTFFASLPFSFLFFSLAWLFIAPAHLYHCWDDAPPFLISWHPPFIHPWANSMDGNLRDYFIWPEWSVYLVWFSFVVGVFLFPVFGAWRFVRRGHDNVA